MKVVFLDIDGVLNSRAYNARRDLRTQGNIDETRLPLVKRIVDATGAKIVLSSTWRRHWCERYEECNGAGKYIVDTFAKYGLKIFDKTPDLGLGAFRVDEIKRWLADAGDEIKAFVIDDCRFGWEDLSDRFVRTDPNFGSGLEEEQVEKAIEILNAEGL